MQNGLGYGQTTTLLFLELDGGKIIARYIFTAFSSPHPPGFINHSTSF